MKKTLLILAIISGTYSMAQTENETLGTGAGASITTGDYNVAVGDFSLTTLTSGSMNVSMGWRSAYSLTTSSEGVYIGYEAGYSGTTATDNVMVGFRSGYYNNATDNTFVGNAAGFYNTTGFDNTFIGEKAGARTTDGDDNTFVGASAGNATEFISSASSTADNNNPMTGSDNTAVGSSAGANITSGYRNAFLGSEAGYDVTTGYANTFVGDSAGVDLSIGFKNTFVGQGAGAATEYASNNTFIGFKAGGDNNRTNTNNLNDGQRNTYVGTQTGSISRTGSDNVGLGCFANFSNNTFSRCTFIGSGGQGYDNSGWFDGYGMARANDVIVMGYKARNAGQYGIAIGNEIYQQGVNTIALGYQTSVAATGDYGVSIGTNSNLSGVRSIGIGAYNVVAGDSSVALGTNTNVSGNHSVAIGYGATTTQDNSMVLGGATPQERVSVGVGTTTPNTMASLTLADTDKGILINRMTTAQRTTFGGSLTAVEQGMAVYDTDLNGIFTWDGTAWNTVTNTDAQTLSLTGTTLDISNGNSVNLSSIDTDTQLSESQVDAYVANNGYLTSFTEVDGDITNEIQDISLTGTDLTISSGSTIDLSSIDTDTQLSETQVDAFVANNGYLTTFTEVDGDITNEIQDISLTGTDLTISSGSTIDLSSIDTDTQLSESQVDAFVANNGYLTTFTEVDGDITNEIQDISLTGTDLTISSGSTIDLSSIDTDTQLSESQVDAFVANNGYLTSFTEVDGDITNEIQDISLSGSDLTISSGSTIDLSSIDTDTDEQDLTAATLTGTNLQIEIENGASVSVDLSPLLTDLQTQINDLETRLTILEECACDGSAGLNQEDGTTEKAILYQNIPNPFNNTSSIKYYIPSWATSANLVVSDGMGKVVSNISLNEVGDYGTSHVNAEGLQPATYYYSLYVNQTLVDTKKMVVQ